MINLFKVFADSVLDGAKERANELLPTQYHKQINACGSLKEVTDIVKKYKEVLDI